MSPRGEHEMAPLPAATIFDHQDGRFLGGRLLLPGPMVSLAMCERGWLRPASSGGAFGLRNRPADARQRRFLILSELYQLVNMAWCATKTASPVIRAGVPQARGGIQALTGVSWAEHHHMGALGARVSWDAAVI